MAANLAAILFERSLMNVNVQLINGLWFCFPVDRKFSSCTGMGLCEHEAVQEFESNVFHHFGLREELTNLTQGQTLGDGMHYGVPTH
jgi:hypothetical protein